MRWPVEGGTGAGRRIHPEAANEPALSGASGAITHFKPKAGTRPYGTSAGTPLEERMAIGVLKCFSRWARMPRRVPSPLGS